MSPDVLLECPRTSFRDVLRVNVTERVWHSPLNKWVSWHMTWYILRRIILIEIVVVFLSPWDEYWRPARWQVSFPPPRSWDNAWQLNCCRVVAFTLPDQSHDSSQRFRVTEIWWAMQMERTGLCNSWRSSTKKFFRLNLIFWKAQNLELRSSIYFCAFSHSQI